MKFATKEPSVALRAMDAKRKERKKHRVARFQGDKVARYTFLVGKISRPIELLNFLIIRDHPRPSAVKKTGKKTQKVYCIICHNLA